MRFIAFLIALLVGLSHSTAVADSRSFKTTRVKAEQGDANAQDTLGEIGSQLNSIMVDVGEITGTNFSLGEPNEDAQKILAEASAIAEKRVNETFPDVPTSNADEPIFTSGEQG